MKSGGRVLVTGADGFIGSHLVEALVAKGYELRAFVYYNAFGSWGWLDDAPPRVREAIEVVSGDIRDAHVVREATRDCEAVIHLAALIGIPYSYRAPASYVDTNVAGTVNVLEAARDLGVARVIHTSTSEVYGTARRVPIDEDHPLLGQSPYSATKIAADQMAIAFHRSFATPVAILRPFNTFGPRQSARAVIPTILTQLISGNRTIRLGSLDTTRDFSFVADTVAGFLAMLEAEGVEGEVVNLGTGYDISIGDTARMIADVAGASVEIVPDRSRVRPETSEVLRLQADNSKARRLLGWTPEYAGRDGIRRGIEVTYEWFREPANQARYKPELYNI
jgi:NAD dependent epimerase/dehydratase